MMCQKDPDLWRISLDGKKKKKKIARKETFNRKSQIHHQPECYQLILINQWQICQ